MTVEPASSARIIFLAASKLPDEAARQAFLTDACGEDQALRQKVERLLAAISPHAESPLQLAVDRLAGASFAEYLDLDETSPSNVGDNEARTAADNDATRGRIDIATHPLIGPYKLLEEIGHGGMGAVYMAQQTHPVKRKVALKVIKPGMDTREVIARFEAERQALAMMDHPNIAKVLDGGTTDAGRPYFVMELVRGVPLTEFCRAKKLGLRERLQLFIHVCKAVQHAHQKGIIHRDLKPSNLLVTLHDGVPVVKVIDFGVAKALNQELTERTLFTHFSQMIGTPLYMAPEQAEMSGLDIDTRSDIYSLGVILYELLIGTTPFDRETMSKLGVDGIRKLLKEEDPQRPSVRMSTLRAANQSTIDDPRVLDAQEVTRQLKRELDWIVMKALEKDRERRYESANAFAADVQRYLDDEPVEACPPSISYRLRKYSKRHKAMLTTAAILMAMLVTSTIVSTMFAIQAKKSQVAAEANLASAFEAVDKLLEHATNPELREIPRAQPLRKEIVADALDFYERFRKTTGDSPTLRMRAAKSQSQFARLSASSGGTDNIFTSIENAIAEYEALIAADPSDTRFQSELANSLTELGFYYQNEFYNYEEAQTCFEKAWLIWKSLADSTRDDQYQAMVALTTHRIAETHRHLENPLEYQELNQAARETLLPLGHPSYIAVAASHAGNLAKTNPAQAHSLWMELLPESRKSMQQNGSRGSKTNHASILQAAITFFEHRDHPFAKQLAEEMVEITDELQANFPSSKAYQYQLCCARSKLALLVDDVDFAQVVGEFRNIVRLWDSVQRDGAYEIGLASRSLTRQRRYTDAILLADVARRDGSSDHGYMIDAALCEAYLGQERYEDAILHCDEAIRKHPSGVVAWLYKRRALASFQLGQFSQTLADLETVLELAPDDVSDLTWIPVRDVARCDSEELTEGIRQLADRSVELNHHSEQSLLQRATLKVGLNDWSLVSEDLEAEIGEATASSESFFQSAILALRADAHQQYRRICVEMLGRFQDSGTPHEKFLTGWTCALAADAIEDYGPGINLVRHAVANGDGTQQYTSGLGAILMRAGEYAEAKEHLEAALKATGSDNTSTSYVRYFLAMTEQHLGNTEAAKEHLQAANGSAEKELAESPLWNRELTLELLRQEAEGLINASKEEESANDENN